MKRREVLKAIAGVAVASQLPTTVLNATEPEMVSVVKTTVVAPPSPDGRVFFRQFLMDAFDYEEVYANKELGAWLGEEHRVPLEPVGFELEHDSAANFNETEYRLTLFNVVTSREVIAYINRYATGEVITPPSTAGFCPQVLTLKPTSKRCIKLFNPKIETPIDIDAAVPMQDELVQVLEMTFTGSTFCYSNEYAIELADSSMFICKKDDGTIEVCQT